MRIDVAIRVMPVEGRGDVELRVDTFVSTLSATGAQRLARELSYAARRAEKLALTKPQPKKEPK